MNQSNKRLALRFIRNASAPVVIVLTLAGCVTAPLRPMGYGYRNVPQPYYSPAITPPVQPQPYIVQHPAPVAAPVPPADPPPLRPVDPPDSYRIDTSCVGYWRLCHLL